MLRPPAGAEPPKAPTSPNASRLATPPLSDSKSKARKNKAETEETEPLSGPSFLGLAEPEKTTHEYLLEDEPSQGHGRMYIALLLLIIAGALMYWHWRQNGYPWMPKTAAGPSSNTTATAPTSGTTTPAPQTATPQSGAESAPSAVPPATPAADNGADTETATPPAPGVTEANSAQPPSTQLAPGEAAEQYSDSEVSTESHTQAAPAESAKPELAKTPSKVPSVAPPITKAVHPEAHLAETAVPSPHKPSVAAPVLPPEDEGAALAAQGERYLYGNGVVQNCDLAQKSLLMAAGHANVKSQILLGTMYATGHCATRNLPSAYGWYAKALHHDPGNKRISDDLEAIWREMTPAERQQTIQ